MQNYIIIYVIYVYYFIKFQWIVVNNIKYLYALIFFA